MSSKTTYQPGAGDVVLQLGKDELTLRPSLDAALTLSRQAGGIRTAITRVLDLDLDVIVSVIRLGIGREEARRFKDLDRAIWENGVLDTRGEVVSKCVEYLSNLARGGRPAADEGRDGDDDNKADPPKALN